MLDKLEFKRFTNQNIAINVFLILAYLVLNNVIGEIKTEHIVLPIIWLLGFYIKETSRRFILGFSVFIIFWIIYDSMRIIPNYEVSVAHIKEPYLLEKYLFGISTNDGIVSPNEYLRVNTNVLLDFLSGFFYINWMPVPIGFAIYLYLKNKKLYLKYALTFLLVNIMGFIIYYIYPAAPPWYVDLYGFDLHIGVSGNRAGLARFDQLIGYPIFEGIYNKNANVLAAMPSLHSAYPVIVLYFAISKRMNKYILSLFVLFMIGIWFSAVYSSHHYIIDVLAGVILALCTIILFRFLERQSVIIKYFKYFYNHI